MDIRPIRRVVTGHDAQGRAVVVMDGRITRPERPVAQSWPSPGHAGT